MIKLILLDRDGVLNRELGGYVTNKDDFEVLPHVVPALIKLRDWGCRFVVITNQSGIAKGLYDHPGLHEIHGKLRSYLDTFGLTLDEIYYCPHHPDFTQCLCRKPKSSMIERALARFGFAPHEAVMIGDTARDIEAARGAGVVGYKIGPNEDWSHLADDIIGLQTGHQA